MTLEELRKKYPNWEINEPHFLEAREGSAAGEVGWDAHWRQWANPTRAPSRYTVTAFASEREGVSQCLKEMDSLIAVKDVAWKAEM
jgi:hypothetical protein